MTAKTRATFQVDQATAFADNTSGAITPSVLRGQVVDLSDSAVFPGDPVPVNAQTGTAYTLVLSDAQRVVTCDNAAAVTVTVPANATAALPVGTIISVVQIGAGAVTVTGATGVTVNGASAGSVSISARWQGVSLLKIATDTWVASGALA